MGTFVGGCDQCFLDSVAQESVKLHGTDGIVFQLVEGDDTIDPVWGEEKTVVYKAGQDGKPGIPCQMFFKDPDKSSLSGEEGFQVTRTSQVEISVIDLRQKGLDKLHVGDIVYVWGMYFDVIENHTGDSQIADTGYGTMVVFDVVRRSKGVPESIWRVGEDNG